MSKLDARQTDGCNALANAKLTPRVTNQLKFSETGCAYRGTTWCTLCPWGRLFAVWECNYRCDRCEHQGACPCGFTEMTVFVERWFGIEQVGAH